ncbi:lysophospholipid acyltransferase family protein [Croceiramulus getboli]|nr:lipid A biosynthesis acyltransferase [Flavobacteriaceae bacterium YJPT1-3]
MQKVVFLLVYPLLWGISKLPFQLLYGFSDGVNFLVYRLIGYRRKVVRTNLQLAFPEKSKSELSAIEKKFYSHLCDLFLEMIKSISVDPNKLQARMQFENPELLQELEAQGKSAILIMGHYANYEWLSVLQFHLNNTGFGIYKPIKNKYFDQWVHRIRARFNSGLIPNKVIRKVISDHQEEGRVGTYLFIADQSTKGKVANHFRTSFFGYELPFFTGVERIAKKEQLPVVFVEVCKVSRGHYKTKFQLLAEQPDAFADFEITAAFAKALEQQIKRDPAYYLWTHKRFKHLQTAS